MKPKRLFSGLFLVLSFLIMSCADSDDSVAPGIVPATAAVPITQDGTIMPGPPPDESTDGPAILGMESLPTSDVTSVGATFSLLIEYDSVSFPALGGLILYLEGAPEYFTLLTTSLPGGLAIASFTIRDDFPRGDYVLWLALQDDEGAVGEYVQIVLHVALVPTLEILELYPLAAAINPENRIYEPLNAVGRVVFSRPVTTPEFTLEIQDDQGTPIPGLLRLLPGNLNASFIPTQLLGMDSSYTIVATLPDEDIVASNPFFTETATPLGGSSSNVIGRVFSFAVDGTNVVEPEAAKAVFSLLGTAIPPFLIVVTELDPVGEVFSAYGSISYIDKETEIMSQDYRVPVIEFALGAEYNDPYFFAGPTNLPLSFTVSSYTVNLTFYDFTQSGKFSVDGGEFVGGAVSLYIDPVEIEELVSDLLGYEIDDFCADVRDILGLEVCDINNQIVARAEGVIGTWEPGITALYDILPDMPASTVSAAGGGAIQVSGTLTMNGAPAEAGYSISITSTVGTPNPSPAVTGADGRFTATLTVNPGDATAGTDIVVTFKADLSDGAPELLERTLNIAVDP